MKLINLALITIFIILDKNELIDDVIEYYVCDIEDFYGCFEHNLSASEKEHMGNLQFKYCVFELQTQRC